MQDNNMKPVSYRLQQLQLWLDSAVKGQVILFQKDIDVANKWLADVIKQAQENERTIVELSKKRNHKHN